MRRRSTAMCATGRSAREGETEAFERFPTWMWRNAEVDEFIRWLRAHNSARPYEEMTGFYGLDLYNLHSSMRAVIDFLEREDPEAAKIARRRYGCLEPWSDNPAAYGRMAIFEGYARCEVQVAQMMRDLMQRSFNCLSEECDEWLDAAANARLVKNAEAYYRVMYEGAAESWNLRDTHMFETLCQLLDAKGPSRRPSCGRTTVISAMPRTPNMGQRRDEINIGQLTKEKFGDKARLIGFGTHTGTVAAADDWDEPMQIKHVRPSLEGSYERLSHDSGIERFLLDLREGELDRSLERELMEQRLERFIGVIYRPETERWSHYSHCTLPRQFDAWVWFDETSAVSAPRASSAPGEDDLPVRPLNLLAASTFRLFCARLLAGAIPEQPAESVCAAMTDVKWTIKGREFIHCNCAYGCPCQFNALPTRGNCQAASARLSSRDRARQARRDEARRGGRQGPWMIVVPDLHSRQWPGSPFMKDARSCVPPARSSTSAPTNGSARR